MRVRGFDTGNRSTWVLLALFLAVVWSLSGLIFRMVEEADAAQLIFYRGISLSTFLVGLVAFRYRGGTVRAFRAIGRPGLAAGASLGIGSVFFLYAIMNTTIANVSFIIASTPFLAAALAWVVLRERVGPRTLISCALALVGVAVMVWEGFAFGGWFGNLAALGGAFLMAGYTVALRRGSQVDMMPAVALSGYIAALIAVTLIDSFAISWHDFLLAALQGIVISALCNTAFAYCARHIPAAELTLLSMLETVLSPFWVWLVIAETPEGATLVGGVVVLTAIGFEALWPLRQRLLRRARSVGR